MSDPIEFHVIQPFSAMPDQAKQEVLLQALVQGGEQLNLTLSAQSFAHTLTTLSVAAAMLGIPWPGPTKLS